MLDNEFVQDVQDLPEVPETTENHVQEQVAQPAESQQARNFKELKKQMQQTQRERDELARRLQEVEQSKQASPATTVQNFSDDLNFAPDELAEGKHLNQVAKELKAMKEQLKQYQQQSTFSNAESRLMAEFPDFKSVFTPDNIESLRMADPETAQNLDEISDPYRKAKAVLKAIKNLGLDTQDTYQADKAIIHKNATKPKPSATISAQQGDSPLARANAFEGGLTPELKAQLHKEMMEARRGY